MSVNGLIYCLITTVLKFLFCRQYINSKAKRNEETDENFIHREMHIAFATSLIFMKHLLCHRLPDGSMGATGTMTLGGAVLGGVLEAIITFVIFLVVGGVLKWLYIKREDDEGRAVVSYYLTIPIEAIREIVPGLATILSEI